LNGLRELAMVSHVGAEDGDIGDFIGLQLLFDRRHYTCSANNDIVGFATQLT